MMIIGCDFHTRYQQIAMVDEATGELVERRLRTPRNRPSAPGFRFEFVVGEHSDRKLLNQ